MRNHILKEYLYLNVNEIKKENFDLKTMQLYVDVPKVSFIFFIDSPEGLHTLR